MTMAVSSLNPFSRFYQSAPECPSERSVSAVTNLAHSVNQAQMVQAYPNASVTNVQSLMQGVVSAYQQVFQAGLHYPGNILIFKRFIQDVEFEVLKINVGGMKSLRQEQKVQIVTAIQSAYHSIFSITMPQYQQLNGMIYQVYSRMTNDPYAANSPFIACQLTHLAYARGFLESLSSSALEVLHRMRVDMFTAKHL